MNWVFRALRRSLFEDIHEASASIAPCMVRAAAAAEEGGQCKYA
jgi:hypothetical protein